MVVVQFLAADQHAERDDVAGSIGGLEVAVTPVVPDAVDDAGSPERDPQHLHGEDDEPDPAEQHGVDDQHQQQARIAEACVNVVLDPVVRRALAERLHGFGVLAFRPVEAEPTEQYARKTPGLRTVRIVLGLAASMMLAMHGDPFPRDLSRGQPQPEAEEVTHGGVQRERAVRLAPVQEDRDRRDRYLGEHQRDAGIRPRRECQQTI